MYNLKVDDFGRYLRVVHYHDPIVEGVTRVNNNIAWVPTLEEFNYKQSRSIKNSVNRSKTKVFDLAFANDWEYFLTLTFDPMKVDRFNYDACSIKVKNWIDSVRREYSDFRYVIVPERHKDGAYHFHALVSGIASFRDSGKKDKKGRPIYNVIGYNNGFTTATKIDDSEKAVSYITKYFTKDLAFSIKGKKKYWASRNLRRPNTVKTTIDNCTIVGFENESLTFDSDITYIKEIEQPIKRKDGTVYNKRITIYFIKKD